MNQLPRPVLMQSDTWLEKVSFRSETKNGFHMQLEKRLFNPRFFDYVFQLDETLEKTKIFDPTRQSDSCLGNVRKFRRILVRVSPTHTTTRHTTRPQTTTSATLAWLLSLLLLLDASQRDTSLFLRPSAARGSP